MARAHGRTSLFGIVLALATCVDAAQGCPFCGVVGDSLAMRRDAADVVAVAEADGVAGPGADGFLAQPFRLDQILRGRAPNARVTAARVDGPVTGTALVFGATSADGIAWTAVAANEALLGYAAAAPATTRPPAERLRWFAGHLEHPELAIAADAFTEFGQAPFTAVCEAADGFDPVALESWVSEPGIDPRRRGFYGLAAGIVAAKAADRAVRDRLLGALATAIRAPGDDFRAGFDGLLAGVLVAEGAQGLERLATLGLLAPTTRPVDQRHLLTAFRFAAENLAATLPPARVAEATAALLDSPAVAAEAIVDLARMQAWESIDTVARLWATLGHDDPLVRRAVAGYLDACPRPEAKARLAAIRTADPARLDAALEAARSPFAR